MGLSLTGPTMQEPRLSQRQRLMRVFSMVRYRFFLYAGLLPYLLGAAWEITGLVAQRRIVFEPPRL